MAHFDDLDELLDFEEVKIDRLLPARILQASGIPLVVFGQDALAFDDFVPNFFDLTILVPCDLVQTSVDVLQRQLPQCQVTQERDNTMMNRDGTCALPRAVRLQGHLSNVIPTFIHEPGKILIVPQSHFHFDVNDSTRTRGLISPFDPSGEPILFPTVISIWAL